MPKQDWMLPFLYLVAGMSHLGLGEMKTNAKRVKRVKRPRAYNLVRVINPKGTHAVRVHPRQGVRLVLDSPQIHKNISEGARLEVKVNSPYLFLDEVDANGKGQVVYIIRQTCDLSNWADVSEIFLGEISVELVGNTHPKKQDCLYDGACLGVYHLPAKQDSQVLTVINPQDHTIKLEPHRTLEVVCFCRAWAGAGSKGNEEWMARVEYLGGPEVEGIYVEQIKEFECKTRSLNPQFSLKAEDFTVIPRYCPSVNSLLHENEQSRFSHNENPDRQHHFWLAFTKKSIQKISSLKTGKYVLARVVLTGTACDPNDKPVKVKHEFILVLSKHGKPVKKDNQMTLLLTNEAARRDFSCYNKLLTNPGQTEQLDFHAGFEDCVIEVAVPKVYWDEEPVEARWIWEKCEEGINCLDITSLADIKKLGINYQRFNIERQKDKFGTSNGFLGAIKIVYPPKADSHDGNRRLSVWFEYQRNHIYSGATNTGQRIQTHYKDGLGTFIPGRTAPKIALVQIAEIACAKLGDGAKVMKVSEANSYCAKDWDNYYYGTPVSKKKERDATSIPASHVLGNPPTGEKRSGLWTSGFNNRKRTTEISQDSIESIILQNPANLQEVTLAPDQCLIIRLMPPEDVLTRKDERERSHGELWGLNLMAVGDMRPVFVKHCILEAGTSRYRQEIVVKADSSHLPPYSGNYPAGAVHLQCSGTSRVIRLYVNKEHSTEQLHSLPQMEFTSEIQVHEANQRRNLLAQNWSHNAAVRIKPTDIIYVRDPDAVNDGNDWRNMEWSIQFIQHPISKEIWDKLDSNVKDKVDRMRPWYARDYPIYLHKTLITKAIDQTAVECEALVDSLKKTMKQDYIPVATVSFIAHKSQEVENDMGLIESIVKVRRDIHLCLDLSKPKPTGGYHSVYRPVDRSIHQLKVNDIISIHLCPKEAEEGYYPWDCTYHPQFMEYIGSSTSTGDDVFRFKVKAAGCDWIKLKCDTNDMWLRINAS